MERPQHSRMIGQVHIDDLQQLWRYRRGGEAARAGIFSSGLTRRNGPQLISCMAVKSNRANGRRRLG